MFVSDSPVIFAGDAQRAYRDPACILFAGEYHLFFTLSVKENGFMYNYTAQSVSADLKNWTQPQLLTEKNLSRNYCSPGCVLQNGDEYLLCVSSYPLVRPYAERWTADETARLYLLRTRDFVTFSKPEPIMAKGDLPLEEQGRMIDPYLLRDKDDSDKLWLFYKQNGVSCSVTRDLRHWEPQGSVQGGENACILARNGQYLLLHSPKNGIGFKRSVDLRHWEDLGVTTLGQADWPWASGRLTAGFAMEAGSGLPFRYLLFFHGSRRECPPETHGAASLAVLGTDDFVHYTTVSQ